MARIMSSTAASTTTATATATTMMMILWLAIATISINVAEAQGGGISIYWGGEGATNEITLAKTCESGYFDYVNIAYLESFGNFTTPILNIGNHVVSSDQIEYCQGQGIKVMLSLDAHGTLASIDDAKNLTGYLWDNFLGGSSSTRPFGSAVLDGIDFHIFGAATTDVALWAELAKFLSEYNNMEPIPEGQKRVQLSGNVECIYPDYYLDTALKTGLFDYVWIEFFHNSPCEYKYPSFDAITGDMADLLATWNQWTENLPGANKIFLGIPASPSSASSGYIKVTDLINQVLPAINETTKYGGVMIWSNDYTETVHYAEAIKEYV